MAARRNKFNSLEIQLASSILYYDEIELERFFEIYDAIAGQSNIAIDGVFDMFVSYLKYIKFNEEYNDSQKRYNYVLESIKMRNDQIPNKNQRENFELWFSKVLETDVPMELAEDILDHFVWESYKKTIEEIDKSDMPFKEKLAVRPQMPNALNNNNGIVFLDDIDVEKDTIDSFYTSGLEDLDLSVKFRRTNFVVIAARPGVGKSLFMIQMAAANARNGVKTLYLSFEMGQQQIDDRILNYYLGENLVNKYTDEYGVLDFEGYKKARKSTKMTKGFKAIKQNLQLYVDKSSSADSILTRIEDLIKENGYEAIFIDYLQLLRFNRLDEWASLRQLTNSLKNLAFRNNVLVVTGCQVSRSSTEKGLYLTDLFGSSSIEADTDTVLGLEQVRERRQGEKSIINVKTLKQREGDLTEMKYVVDYSTGRLTYSD